MMILVVNMTRSGPYPSYVVSNLVVVVVVGSFLAFLDFAIVFVGIFSSNCCDHDQE